MILYHFFKNGLINEKTIDLLFETRKLFLIMKRSDEPISFVRGKA